MDRSLLFQPLWSLFIAISCGSKYRGTKNPISLAWHSYVSLIRFFVYGCDMWVEGLQSHTPVLLCCFLSIYCHDVWIERLWNTLPHSLLAALLVPINSHDVRIERPWTTVFVLVRIQPSPPILESYMSTRIGPRSTGYSKAMTWALSWQPFSNPLSPRIRLSPRGLRVFTIEFYRCCSFFPWALVTIMSSLDLSCSSFNCGLFSVVLGDSWV